jgi:hypothetical protein
MDTAICFAIAKQTWLAHETAHISIYSLKYRVRYEAMDQQVFLRISLIVGALQELDRVGAKCGIHIN